MHWDPLHELVALRDRATRGSGPSDGSWTPSVDLLETESVFVLVVELPGLQAGDFAITATADGLLLTGQRPTSNVASERFLRMERGHGRFARSFTFGTAVSVADVQADFQRGLLKITVPKSGTPADRRIAIG